jgi:hypothetical protein
MSGDISLLLIPGGVDDAALVEAAREALASVPPEIDLAALALREGDPAGAALGERIGPFAAVSFWSEEEAAAPVEALVQALSRRLGKAKLLVAYTSEYAGLSGWRVFERGKPGKGEAGKGEAPTIPPAALEAACGAAIDGLDIHALAHGPRGVRLLPLSGAGAAVAGPDVEKVLYDCVPLVFSGTGELANVRRPRPKRRLRRFIEPVTEVPRDWKRWAEERLGGRDSLEPLVARLAAAGVVEATARAHLEETLAARRDAYAWSGKVALPLGLVIALVGVAWLLHPLVTSRRGRLVEPERRAVVIAVGAVLAAVGVYQKRRARACA